MGGVLLGAPRRDARAWLAGVGFSLACNAGLIGLVVAISHPGQVPIAPDIPVLHISQVSVPPPPPTQPSAPSTHPAPAPAALPPLPRLLPLPDEDTRLSLPPPSLDPPQAGPLPLLLPPLAGAGPIATTAPNIGAPPPLTADQPPRITAPIAIARFYPPAARDRGITGDTVLSLTVAATGQITQWHIVQSTPPGVFETAVAQLVRSLRAEPALFQGRPVTATTRLRVAWTLAP